MTAARASFGAAGIFVLANVVAAAATASYVPSFVTERPTGDAEPRVLVVSASYGADGIDVTAIRGAARWVHNGTSPASWRHVLGDPDVLTPTVEVVVVQLAPVLVAAPAPAEDLALRRIYGPREIPWFVGLGEYRDAVEVATNAVVPLYRVRHGARQALWSPPDAPPPPLPEPFAWDASEHAALAGLIADVRGAGRRVVIAEWPLSDDAPAAAHTAVAERFRPELARLAGEDALVDPPGPWRFEDGLHGTPADGARWSRWLAAELAR